MNYKMSKIGTRWSGASMATISGTFMQLIWHFNSTVAICKLFVLCFWLRQLSQLSLSSFPALPQHSLSTLSALSSHSLSSLSELRGYFVSQYCRKYCVLFMWDHETYRVSQKKFPKIWEAMTPPKMALGTKVGWFLKFSGPPLSDGHWNFLFLTMGAWENWV